MTRRRPSARYLAERLLSVSGAYLVDRARKWPPVSTIAAVPTSRHQLSRKWLTAALCTGHPGAVVEDFETYDVSSGTATRWGFRVSYNEAGQEAELPTDLFAKTTQTWRQRLAHGFGGVQATETTFYATFRRRFDIEAPQGYFGTCDPRSWRSIAIMEDLVATKGATFLKPTDPLSRPDIEALLADMAIVHGRFWDSEELTVAGLRTFYEFLVNADSYISWRPRCRVGEQRALSVLPGALVGRWGDVFDAAVSVLERDQSRPQALLHGDPHAGNIYRTAEGRVGFCDWQAVARGSWAHDVTYAIHTSLAVEDRRAWEHDLLALYLDRLAAAGGKAPGFDDGWLEYRRHAFYGYIAWAFPIGRAFYHPKWQPDEYCLAILERASNAIVDLDSFSAVQG
jgi:hypothetical protein